jgi:hypothetical protein
LAKIAKKYLIKASHEIIKLDLNIVINNMGKIEGIIELLFKGLFAGYFLHFAFHIHTHTHKYTLLLSQNINNYAAIVGLSNEV